VTLYLAVPLLVVVAVLQASVISHLSLWGVFPDLPALVVVSWGLLRGAREGSLWGFVTGLAVDILSGGPFGAATLSLMMVGFVSGLARGSVFAGHLVFPVATMFLTTVLYDLGLLSLIGLSGRTVSWMDTLFRIILPSALLNALLMPLVFGLMRVLNNRLNRQEMEW
jgi:rod shape-determining protein MreD